MSFNTSAGLPPVRPVQQALWSPMARHTFHMVCDTLRKSNEFYSMIAISIRESRTPTHHARKVAVLRRLSVNTQKAKKCPMRYVAKDPLPLLDLSLGPNTPPARSIEQDLYHSDPCPYISLQLFHPKPRLPPIVIPAIGSERRRIVMSSPTIAPHEQAAEIFLAPGQSSPYLYANFTPNTREIPVFNVHVWDSNIPVQGVPGDAHIDEVVMDIAETEIVLTPFSTMAEHGSEGYDVLDEEDRFRFVLARSPQLVYPPTASVESSSSSGSSSTSTSSRTEISTPSDSDGLPMSTGSTGGKRKYDSHEEDDSSDIALYRKPAKYLRKEVALGHAFQAICF